MSNSGSSENPMGGESPLQRYLSALAAGSINPDPAQQEAVEALDRLYHELLRHWRRQDGVLGRLRGLLKRGPSPRGLYLWGGVGRGKTWLMDLFFRALPGERKRRLHFHRFMRLVHARLEAHKGQANPLRQVAREFAREAQVLCFDEFYVSDIGDAMILANLLEALFDEGVVLVATSNIEPRRLYENGLQRQRFLPAIDLLERHVRVLNVDGGVDYRLRNLERAEIYHFPLGEEAEKRMGDTWLTLARGEDFVADDALEILGRRLPVRRRAEGLVWFEFAVLCEGPRSAADYIEIAQLFHTVLLSEVPVLDERRDDATRRFISLVDEFYDHGVKLVLSAAAPLEELYQGRELAFPFQRTVSRLLEMQSHDYLAREHRP